MAKKSSDVAHLTDIVEAIRLIRTEIAGIDLDAFEGDIRKRWLVERGLEIISEASRRLSPALKARHNEIPWRKVAGLGNVLRHEYQRIAHDILWRVVNHDLDALEKICELEVAAEKDRDHEKPRK